MKASSIRSRNVAISSFAYIVRQLIIFCFYHPFTTMINIFRTINMTTVIMVMFCCGD